MKHLCIICAVVWVALALSSCASTKSTVASRDSVLLELRPEKGQRFRTTKTTTAVVTATVMGEKVNFSQESRERTKSIVSSVSGETLQIKETLERVSALISTGKRVIEFDSSKPAQDLPPPAQLALSLVGQTLVITLNRRGEIDRISGIEPLIERLRNDPALDEERREDLDRLRRAYTQTGITGLGRRPVVFPMRRLSVGDSWTETTRADVDRFAVTVHESWSLAGRKNSVATLDVTMKLSLDPASELAQLYAALSMEFSAKAIGLFEVDEKTGLVLRSRVVLEMAAKRSEATPDFMGDSIYRFTTDRQSVIE